MRGFFSCWPLMGLLFAEGCKFFGNRSVYHKSVLMINVMKSKNADPKSVFCYGCTLFNCMVYFFYFYVGQSSFFTHTLSDRNIDSCPEANSRSKCVDLEVNNDQKTLKLMLFLTKTFRQTCFCVIGFHRSLNKRSIYEEKETSFFI